MNRTFWRRRLVASARAHAVIGLGMALGWGCADGETSLLLSSGDDPCEPSCDFKYCGDDGCGGACPDLCAPGEVCSSFLCVEDTGTPDEGGHKDDPEPPVPIPCDFGEATCESPTTRKICDHTDGSFDLVPCAADEICSVGNCVPQFCGSDDPPQCVDGKQQICNSIGSGFIVFPCPSGTKCVAGACVTLRANVLLVVDTSGSMQVAELNWWDESGCDGGGGDGWPFPQCEDPLAPCTRIGRAKVDLSDLVQSEFGTHFQWALQRFPQGTAGSAQCGAGYYVSQSYMTGDNNQVPAPIDGWFGDSLHEVLVVPFSPTGQTDLEALGAWFDFDETLTASGEGSCISDLECEGHICDEGVCKVHDNPELRPTGITPLGKSLFYAGEYFRHRVLMEGKPCSDDASCESPHHVCEEGVCHDEHGACRLNIILLFTDGAETQFTDPDSFFHPRTQAKRLHYGLGCTSDEECLSGATCVNGGCSPPAEEVNTGANASGSVTVQGAPGERHITDQGGNPVALTVHVMDASKTDPIPGNYGNAAIAAYGGGTLTNVDLGVPGSLFSSLGAVLGDAKTQWGCPGFD